MFNAVPNLGNVFSVNFDRAASYEQALDAGSDYLAMCKWLYLVENEHLRGNRGQISNSTQLFDAVKNALVQLVEGVVDIGFEGLPPRLIVTTLRKGQENRLFLDQLSDGYRNLIGLVLDFARRLALANPNVTHPLDEPGILLVDEIDLHLHAGWQQTIIPKLRTVFPNTQIIATTHSPQVLTSVEPRSIRILDGLTLHSAPSGTLGAESKMLLEQVFGVPSRPPEEFVRPVRELRELFDLINAGDLAMAKDLVKQFVDRGYETDPAIIEADLTIENRLWEQESGS